MEEITIEESLEEELDGLERLQKELEEARAEAGSSSWAIKGCICQQIVSDGLKQFYCDVFTFDPSTTMQYLSLTCFYDGQTCTMESNVDQKTFTFAEISQLLS